MDTNMLLFHNDENISNYCKISIQKLKAACCHIRPLKQSADVGWRAGL